MLSCLLGMSLVACGSAEEFEAEKPAVIEEAEAPGEVSLPWYLDCSSRNNSYCSYTLDRRRACCVPTYVAPGAYCPDICI